MILTGGDGTRHFQVLDGSSVDVAEGGKALLAVVSKCDGDGVAVTEEGALERVGFVRAGHVRDVDIGHQLHVLTTIGGAAIDKRGKTIPVFIVADDVGIIHRTSADGRAGNYVSLAARKHAVLEHPHQAIVLHEAAEFVQGDGVGDGRGALRCAEGLGVVAVGNGGIGVAADGLCKVVFRRVDGQRGGSEEAVADGCVGTATFGIVITCNSGATGVAAACHRAVEHAAFDGEAAAFRAGDEASEGGVRAEGGGERHAADAAGDGGVAEADANDTGEQFAVGVACAVDGACRAQVLDGGSVDALERCGEAALVAQVDGQCVVVAVKDAAEGLVVIVGLVAAGHVAHADGLSSVPAPCVGQSTRLMAEPLWLAPPQEPLPPPEA